MTTKERRRKPPETHEEWMSHYLENIAQPSATVLHAKDAPSDFTRPVYIPSAWWALTMRFRDGDENVQFYATKRDAIESMWETAISQCMYQGHKRAPGMRLIYAEVRPVKVSRR